MAISDASACKKIDAIYKIYREAEHRKRELITLRAEQVSPTIAEAIERLIDAEQKLLEKKGIFAADLYEHVRSKISNLKHLLLHEAQTRAGFAYTNISSGSVQKAVNCYILLGYSDMKAWFTVAEGLVKVKGFGFAAQCYNNAGKPEVAARMFAKQGKFQEAGWYFELAKQFKHAAVQYKKGKYFDKAGDCYKEANEMHSAVMLWKKAGTLDRKDIGTQLIEKYSAKKKKSASASTVMQTSQAPRAQY